ERWGPNQRIAGRHRHSPVRATRPNHAYSGSSYSAAACPVRRHRRLTTRRPSLMSTKSSSQRLVLASLALISLTSLAGCGALVVGGAAATTAVVATDRRTTGEQVEDKAIEMKVAAEMRKLFSEIDARVNVT